MEETKGKPSFININASLGPTSLHFSLPSDSSFAFMKKVIEEKTGVEAPRLKILFRGKEKEDWEYLREAGVKDQAKVLVLVAEEAPPATEGGNKLEETEEVSVAEVTEEMSKAFQAIAEVGAEVDKLAERVSALEVAVNGETKVADEEFVVSAELLMRQLLKLDAIDAVGEAKLRRKAEVRRVQNFHEMLDNLKARNSNPVSNNSNAVSVTTEWETFDSGMGSLNPPPPPVSSSTRITQDWERFD